MLNQNMRNMVTCQVSALFFVGTVLPLVAETQARSTPQGFGKEPLHFEPNQGQTDSRVKFLSRGNGYTLFLTPVQAVLSLGQQDPRVLRMRMLGANTQAKAEALGQLPGTTNYFVGNNASQWRTGVANYGRVQFDDVYPGIDLVYYGNQQTLEYDLVLRAGADPRRIRMKFDGADEIRVDSTGDLVLTAAGHQVRQQRPVVYQTIGGSRHEIAGKYVLRGKDEVAFEVSNYDASKTLVIDPTLIYSTYWGGGPYTQGFGIAVDGSDNIYITGRTFAVSFPTVNPLDLKWQPSSDQIFLTKMTNTGTVLSSSVFGGSNGDCGNAIAVDSLGDVYLTGYTQSSDFPVVNAWQPHLAGGRDAFVMKVDLTGNRLAYSTFLGGSTGQNVGNAIYADGIGNVYVTGFTYAFDFPVFPAGKVLQGQFGGDIDGFVTKLSGTGSPLYSTYFGGPADDVGNAIEVDAGGNAYVTGGTLSQGLATTGAFQTICEGCSTGGGLNAFVLKLSSDGAAKSYFTYLGGSGGATGAGIAVDGTGNHVYVAGKTSSPSFPLAKPLQNTLKGSSNAFVTELNATGSALVFSTYLGGSGETGVAGIKIDSWGNMYVAGDTTAADFPTTANAIQTHNAGGLDVFVTAYNAGSSGYSYMYSTYLGGSSDDYGNAIALDWSTGNVFVTGEVDSSNFPTVKPAQASLNQAPVVSGGQPVGFNAFVFELEPQTPAPTGSSGGSGSGGGTGTCCKIIATHP